MALEAMEMEMEMVMIEALRMEERRNRSSAEACEAEVSSEISMALGMVKPSSLPSSSSSSLSILELILDLALAPFTPRHMEVEMGEAFMATADTEELEMMMVMLKPLDARSKMKNRRCRGDLMGLNMETEMVLQQNMDV